MFTLNYGAKPVADGDYENLNKTYKMNLQFITEMGQTRRDRMYSDSFLGNDSPRIQSMVAKVLEMGLR